MASKLITLPFRPTINLRGGVEAGAKLFVYSTGTTTPVSVYSDSALATPLTNPVVADAFGVFPDVYYNDAQVVRVVMQQANGTVLSDTDPYISDTASAEASADAAATSAAAAEAIARPIYANNAAGLAATAEGEFFFVDQGDGTADLYRHDAGPTATAMGRTTIIDPQGSGAAGLIGGIFIPVANRTALAALDTSRHTTAYLKENGREGGFEWNASDLSTKVTADTQQGIYVAPSGDVTGASGAWVRSFSGPSSIKWFGAVGDGSTNDAAAFYAAANVTPTTFGFAAPMTLIAVPAGEYSIQSEIDVSGLNTLWLGRGGIIKPDRDEGGNIFHATSGVLEFDGVEFDGGDDFTTTATNRSYVILAGNTTTRMERLRVENCIFRRCLATDGDPLGTSGSAKITQVVYGEGVERMIVKGCLFDRASGAAVFTKEVTNLLVEGNWFKDVQWYNVNLDYDTSGIVRGNFFQHDLAEGIFWGGAINTVNNQGLVRNKNILIEGNTFSGNYSYGAVVRIQSDDSITVQDNHFLECNNGTLTIGGNLVGIGVTTRNPDGTTPSDPPRNVRILRNQGMDGFGSGTYRVFIYVNNDMSGGRNPIKGLEIAGNYCDSPTATEYFTALVLVHGLVGGVTDVTIQDNIGVVYLKSSNPVPGAIGLVGSNANGLVDRVLLGGNSIINRETAVGSTQVGIQIGAWVDKVRNTDPNYTDGCHFGVRTISGAGPTLENLDDQRFGTNTTDTLFSQALTRYGKPLTASITYDPPSVAAGASTFTDITVTGAAIGDIVDASFSLDNAGVIFRGYVRVAGSVRVYLTNLTGGAVDLASGTLRVNVRKPSI